MSSNNFQVLSAGHEFCSHAGLFQNRDLSPPLGLGIISLKVELRQRTHGHSLLIQKHNPALVPRTLLSSTPEGREPLDK